VDEALVWGFVGGLIVDLLSGGPLGANVLALVAVAFVAGQPVGQGIGSPVVRLVLLALPSAIVCHLILLAVLAYSGRAVDWGGALAQVAGPSALLNAVLAPFVERPLGWLERRTRREGFVL
jgi:rod shape-determining protein MreD